MIPYSNILGFTLIDSELHRNKFYVDKQVPILMPKQFILPFQFVKPKTGGTVTSFKVVNYRTGVATEIISELRAVGLAMYTYTNYDVLVFKGLFPFTTSIDVGQYYLQFTDSDGTYKSNLIGFKDDVSQLLKLSYYHAGDFEINDNGIIRYDGSFKHWIYLDTEIGQPSYPIEEQVENRLGRKFVYQSSSWKQYQFAFWATEMMLDHMRLIQQHDYVDINWKGQTFNCDDILFTPNWDEFGDASRTTCEFRTNTVTTIQGQTVSDTDYEVDPGACLPVNYSCVAEIDYLSTDYNNGTYNDGANTLVNGEYVIVRQVGLKRVFLFESGYTSVTINQGDIVYDQNTDTYYFGRGYVLQSPIVTEVTNLGGGDYTVKGYSFPNIYLNIYGRLTDSQETLLASYFMGSDIYFEVNVNEDELASVQARPESPACDEFANSNWKTVNNTGIGYMIVGTDNTVGNPATPG